MHMITPGIAASLTPTSIEPVQAAPRTSPRPRPRGLRHRLHLRWHLPHLHLPHRHA
ncbi:MAG TPA: hypothetical protein VLA55_06330 [Ornithinibacter sp.]|nr:hypothetical protein [Ornithinibacter sp.]